MKVFVILSLLLLSALAKAPKDRPVINNELINKINMAEVGWNADDNEGSVVDGLNFEQAQSLCGTLKGGPELPQYFHYDNALASNLPPAFDSREQWPYCPSIKEIRDQSACGLCWAFAAVEAISDRSCIHLNKNISLSAAGLGFCCSTCGYGCEGGYPSAAWKYYQSKGIVEEDCYPYPFAPCDPPSKNTSNPCPKDGYQTQSCPNKCRKNYEGPAWIDNLHKGKSAYSIKGATQIMIEIMKNGPVEAGFTVYEDFLAYKSGVYKHSTGRPLGGHAIKIIGWGTTEDEVPYWIIANSWNTNWGNEGFFWMLRGQNECGIEDGVVAGIPLN